ncbi:hypothetical protein C475_11720 [Halosimplex carlsbadense 2-9-1]|uniref:Uncharacterized protein n=1 Tax=Halosimplex carlsbadense 2-9-1 TaxID=797114 RepID=M0CQI4_9EURY|nr:hypothetical protein C475_11720 [Halosimplex carlsbadense 2-9-1]
MVWRVGRIGYDTTERDTSTANLGVEVRPDPKSAGRVPDRAAANVAELSTGRNHGFNLAWGHLTGRLGDGRRIAATVDHFLVKSV